MADEILSIGADNLVEWISPQDKVTGASIGDDATGTVTVKDSDGAALSLAEDLEATHASSPDRYYATIPNTVDLTEGSVYYVEFTLTASGGTPHGFKRKRYTAGYDS
jgi:hypothetical protein